MQRRLITATLGAILLGTVAWNQLAVPPLAAEQAEEALAEARRGAADILRYRHGLREVIIYLRAQDALFTPGQLPDPKLRDDLRAAWQRYLDYTLALEQLIAQHRGFHRLPLGSAARRNSFTLLEASYATQYRHALELIELLERNPKLSLLLNEPLPTLGLPKDSYASFKAHFLNVARASEFAALEAVRAVSTGHATFPALVSGLEEDKPRIWAYGGGKGTLLTLDNGLRIVGDTAFGLWLPLQTGVAEWMGDTKVYRTDQNLISGAQIDWLQQQLAPGDVLLERREWYLSNIGLPGYWPHAALYMGTPAERATLAADPDVQAWVRAEGVAGGDFETLLATRYPEQYAASLQAGDYGQRRVIEAIGAGVSFTSLEHSAAADSVAALRPRLTPLAKAQAIAAAFGYVGRPYDYNFDFFTDGELVCTELIYKAYQGAPGKTGLELPLTEIAGRTVLSPNTIAELHAQRAAASPFSFVAFLDGREWDKQALLADEAAFAGSWQRPKWHIWMQ